MTKNKNWFYLPSFHYLILLIGVLGSCSNSERKHQGNKPRQTNVVAKKKDNSIENDITFQDGNGKLIALNDLKGKVVFINFWATWCPPCIAEMPSIQKLYDKVKDDQEIVILTVEVEGKRDKAAKFMERKKLSLPVVYPNSSIPTEFFNGSLPTTVILDKKGNIAHTTMGMADYSGQDIVDFLNELKAMN